MNKLFVAIDGDNAGQQVGTAVLMDDAQKLNEISNKIESGNKVIKDWVYSVGGQMISSGGDEATFTVDPRHESELENLRRKYKEISGFSATFGVGLSLSQSGKALIAGKLQGKDKLVKYDASTEQLLEQAHQQAQAGEGDAEAQKLDEHYLSHMSGDGDIDNAMPANEEGETNEEDFNQYHEDRGDEDMLTDSIQDPRAGDVVGSEGEESFDAYSQEMPESDEGFNAFPEGEDQKNIEDIPPEGDPSFQEEQPIMLPESQEMQSQESEEGLEQPEEKALEAAAPDQASQEEIPTEVAPMDSPEGGLEDAMGADAEMGDIKQRIASNLAMFKENKDLIEQMKDSNPELYQSIMGLLQNLIELAKQTQSDSPEQTPAPEMTAPTDEAPMEGEPLPKM